MDQCADLIKQGIELGKFVQERLQGVWEETNKAIDDKIRDRNKDNNLLRSKINQNNQEIVELEDIISQLIHSHQKLQGPLNLTSTRLALRADRHEIELCKDGAHLALIEVKIHY